MENAGSGRGATAPIGVFDSGLGGLTVARAIRRVLPGEDLVYLGDNARVPYGTRSPSTVLSYARACTARLDAHGIKVLVVACNTVSAVALEALAAEVSVPVLGVIAPGARAGVRASRGRRIGVIATAGTVDSGAYVRAIVGADPAACVYQEAAPLLVPLAEEGWVDGQVPRLAVRRYLGPLIAHGVDTLVLGCTHYPVLREAVEVELAQMASERVVVVDSADATARELSELLSQRHLSTQREHAGGLRMLVTDLPRRFSEVAVRFLGAQLPEVEQIDL